MCQSPRGTLGVDSPALHLHGQPQRDAVDAAAHVSTLLCCLYGCRSAPHSPTVGGQSELSLWKKGKDFGMLYSVALFHMLFDSSECFIRPSIFLCSNNSHINKKSIGLL